MTQEKLTDLDCVMLDSIKILEKWRRRVGGPSICGSHTQDIGSYWFDGDDKDKPIMVYRGETGDRSDPVGDENAVLAEIFERCGEEGLDKRKEIVQQERLYRIWGGRGEYRRTFPWARNSDHDRVDNYCESCSARGLEDNVEKCLGCRS